MKVCRGFTRRRYLVLVALLGIAMAPATSAAPPDKLTPAEAAQVNAMVNSTEQQCNAQATALRKEDPTPMGNPAVPGWAAWLSSGGYCACIGKRIRAGLTATAIRTGTESDGEALVKNSANMCAVDGFKAVFPDMCRSWSRGLPAAEQSQVCACVQNRVDQITGDNLAETVKETAADYIRWQRNRDEPLQAGSLSLIGPFIRCAKDARPERP